MNPAIIINVSSDAGDERQGSPPRPQDTSQAQMQQGAAGAGDDRPVPQDLGSIDQGVRGTGPRPASLDQIESAGAGGGSLPTPGGGSQGEAARGGSGPTPVDMSDLEEQAKASKSGD